MPKHVPFFDNNRKPIVNENEITPRIYFNIVRLKKGETWDYCLANHETVCTLASGTADFTVGEEYFSAVGKRTHIFQGKPESVYAPINTKVSITCASDRAEVFIAGGIYEHPGTPFLITEDDVDTVQYGSDDTKTHRKILHILGQQNKLRTGRLLVSELFTVGAGGWSGYPPHKHDEDRQQEGRIIETAFEEVYHFRFNPEGGFGALFGYVKENDGEPVFLLKNGSTVLLDKGYHPCVVAPCYEMYYYTILVGKASNSLVQFFQPQHVHLIPQIPGLQNMISKFK